MKKGLKIAIIVVIILLILTIGGIVFAYFFTDVFKSDKQVFFKYLGQNNEIFQILQDSDLKKYNEKKKMSSYTTNARISVSDYEEYYITCNGSTDKANKYDYKNVKLYYTNTDALSIHYLNMQDYYGIKIDDVVNKYIAIENNNLKEFFKKMGLEDEIVEQIPNKIDFKDLSLSIFTDQEIETLKSKYTTIILNYLTDSMFSKSETETSKIYSLTLTQPEYLDLTDRILEEIKNDSLIIDKIKQLIMNNTNCTDEQADDFISDLQGQLEYYQDDIRSISGSSEQFITMSIYVENKITTKIEFSKSDDSKIILAKNNNSYEMSVYEQGETTPGTIITIEKNKNEDSVNYAFLITNPSYTDDKIKFELKFSGLSTLDNVKEEGILSEYDGTTIYTYTNNIQFGNITQENVAVDQMLFLNTAPSAENITNLFDQISNRISEVTTSYILNAESYYFGDPFINYFDLAVIPYTGVKAIQSQGTIESALYMAGMMYVIYDNY